MPEQVSHTPGPWVKYGVGFEVRTEEGELIADTSSSNFDDATCRANASVLASALDLLAALEAVNHAFDTGIIVNYEALRDQVKAALAKVKGEGK